MIFRKAPFPLVMLLLLSCNTQKNNVDDTGTEANDLDYAEKFNIEEHEYFTILNVRAPWQNAREASFSYIIKANPEIQLHDSLKQSVIIDAPVEKVVIMSATFISFIDTLDGISSIRGISGSNYIYNKDLREEIGRGSVRDVGFDQSLNFEVLLEMDPDVVFLFGVQAGILQKIKMLENAGIPVVICADYLEPHPLGRAEWLKFFSVFYAKEQKANEIFTNIASRYNKIAMRYGDQPLKPLVMLGLPWKDSWYIAGGRSYAAKMIEDAGGTYIYEDLDHAEATPLDLESVFSRAIEADVWLNPGIARSKEDILSHDQRFANLEVFKEGNIYSNFKREAPGGGNDYWESGVLNPDVVLSDLANIFQNYRDTVEGLNYYFMIR